MALSGGSIFFFLPLQIEARLRSGSNKLMLEGDGFSVQNICTLCVHDGVPSPNVYFTRCNFSKIFSGFLRSFRGVVYDDREKRSQAKKTGSPAGMSEAPPRLQMLDCAALRFVRPEALFQGVDYLFSTLVYKTLDQYLEAPLFWPSFFHIFSTLFT